MWQIRKDPNTGYLDSEVRVVLLRSDGDGVVKGVWYEVAGSLEEMGAWFGAEDRVNISGVLEDGGIGFLIETCSGKRNALANNASMWKIY